MFLFVEVFANVQRFGFYTFTRQLSNEAKKMRKF